MLWTTNSIFNIELVLNTFEQYLLHLTYTQSQLSNSTCWQPQNMTFSLNLTDLLQLSFFSKISNSRASCQALFIYFQNLCCLSIFVQLEKLLNIFIETRLRNTSTFLKSSFIWKTRKLIKHWHCPKWPSFDFQTEISTLTFIVSFENCWLSIGKH